MWHEPWGDRQTELVVIGQDMDHKAVTAALEACVLTDAEMEGGAALWESRFANPWKAAWDKELEIAAIQKAELEGHNAAVDNAAMASTPTESES